MSTETAERSHESRLPSPTPLRHRVVHAVKWQLGSQIASQGWRFAANLVLTRLLVPEAFGLMGMVQVFMVATQMISDVGLLGSVVHHREGESSRFLNTVWTVQVVRGLLLWLLTCIGAYPFAVLYGMPELIWLLPLTGLDNVFRSFASTILLTSRRNIEPKRYVLVEFGSQLVGSLAMIALAAVTHSVSALAIGWVIGGIAYAWMSYCGGDVPWNRLEWDREAGRSILQFGRWTAASSTLTVMQLQGDRMVLGKIFNVAQLGIYSIGANLAMPPMMLFSRISQQVWMPTYAKIRHLPIPESRSKIRRLRCGTVLPLFALMVLIVLFAQPVVDFCYPPAYRAAGWYCSLMAIGVMLKVVTDPGPVFLAYGQARMHFWVTFLRTTTMIAAMVVGFFVGRTYGSASIGVLYGIAFAPLFYYPVQSVWHHRVNAWLPELELPMIGGTLVLFLAWLNFIQ